MARSLAPCRIAQERRLRCRRWTPRSGSRRLPGGAEGIRTSDLRGATCASPPAAGSCSAASSTPFPRGSLAGGCGSASTRIGSSLSSPQNHLLTPLRRRPEPGRGGRSRQAVDYRHARRADRTRLSRRGHPAVVMAHEFAGFKGGGRSRSASGAKGSPPLLSTTAIGAARVASLAK
jgi:hypothetical protein